MGSDSTRTLPHCSRSDWGFSSPPGRNDEPAARLAERGGQRIRQVTAPRAGWHQTCSAYLAAQPTAASLGRLAGRAASSRKDRGRSMSPDVRPIPPTGEPCPACANRLTRRRPRGPGSERRTADTPGGDQGKPPPSLKECTPRQRTLHEKDLRHPGARGTPAGEHRFRRTIVFDTTPGGAGGFVTIRRRGAPAIGTDIKFVDISAIGAPLNGAVVLDCINCLLHFETGAQHQEGPGTSGRGGGGSFFLTGDVPFLGIRGRQLLSGSFTATANTPASRSAGTTGLSLARHRLEEPDS